MGLETAAIILGASALAGSVVQGQKAATSQKRALASQEQAQREAKSEAQAQQRRSEEAMAKTNRQAPDVTSMLASAAQGGLKGGASTMLSGGNIDPLSLTLGRSTLLGQ